MELKGNYNFALVRMLSIDIVNNIGVDKFYTKDNEYYKAPPCSLIRSIDNFERYVLNTFAQRGENIELHNLELDMGALYGMYLTKGKHHYIVTNSKLNVCWSRFTQLKELCTMYVDSGFENDHSFLTKDYRKTVEMAHSEKLKFDTTLLKFDSTYVEKIYEDYKYSTADLSAETFAVFLAADLTIPIFERPNIANYLSDIDSGTMTYNDLAKALLIPEHVLKLYHKNGLMDAEPLHADFAHVS